MTLLLIDGNAIFHRAYFALPAFKTRTGVATNAIHGFFTMLHRAVSDFQPTHVLIAFDTPKPTFRNKLLQSYQAHRPKAPSDFVEQFPYLRKLVDLAGLVRLEKDGFEADDIIGTVAEHYKHNGIRVFILTGDRDILQLVDRNVFVITTLTGISKIAVYNEVEVERKFGVKPNQIPDLKALMGDQSDNYPGAKGIGPKMAAKLIQKYGTVENMYEHLDEIEGKTQDLLTKHKKDVIISKKLATILRDVDVRIELDKSKYAGFDADMKPLLEELELRSLIKRFFEQTQPQAPKQEVKKPKKNEPPKDQMGLF